MRPAFLLVNKPVKKPTRRVPPKPATAGLAEPRAAEALTVAWTLALMATAAADAIALGLWLLGRLWPGAAAEPQPGWLFLPLLALFTAAVSGLVCMILTPLVYRVRRIPPPRAVTVFALVASALPWGVFVAALALNR